VLKVTAAQPESIPLTGELDSAVAMKDDGVKFIEKIKTEPMERGIHA